MPKGDWLRWASALTLQLLALGIALSLVVATVQGALETRHEWEKQHETERRQTRQAAEEIAGDCNIPEASPASVARCLAQEMARYIEQDHSDQDLQAQQDMVYWAQSLFWLTCFSAIISIGALWALIVSLRHTRTAITDTREIGEAQVRAYLSVIPETSSDHLPVLQTGEPVQITFRIKNSGNSPAKRQSYVAALLLSEVELGVAGGDIVQGVEQGPRPQDDIAAGDDIFGKALTDEALTNENLSRIVDRGSGWHLYLVGIVWYEDVFGKPHRTRFCMQAQVSRVVTVGEQHGSLWMDFTKTARHNDSD